MELKQLSYFIQIINDKSFSQAAKNLYLTQQAVSKAIRNLEEELGVPLFYRHASGLELTEYGIILQKKATAILTQSTQIVTEISNLKKKIDMKNVSLVMSYGVIQAFSPNLFTPFNLAYPDVELTIRDHPDFICEDILLNKEADLGCVVGPINNNLLESTLLFSEDLYILINKNNDILEIDNLTIDDLKNQQFVLPTDDFKLPHSFKSCCESKGFTPEVNFVSNQISFLNQLVHFNKGIAITPHHNIFQLGYPNIRFKILPDKNLRWEVYLVKRKYENPSPIVKALWDFLKDSM